MKTSLGFLALLLLPLVPACEPEAPHDPPSIENKSAEDAAVITTEVACDYVARCGIIEVTCADCAEGGDCGGCTVEQIPVTVEECAEDFGPEIEAGFSCQPLTAEEQAAVDECLAALTTAECPAVEEVEDWANGAGEDDPRDATLEACDVFETIMARCYDPAPIGEPEPAPLPG